MEESVECPLCYRTIFNAAYQVHIERYHIGQRSFWQCGRCEFVGGSFDEIAGHCVDLGHSVGQIQRPDSELRLLRVLERIQSGIEVGRRHEEPRSTPIQFSSPPTSPTPTAKAPSPRPYTDSSEDYFLDNARIVGEEESTRQSNWDSSELEDRSAAIGRREPTSMSPDASEREFPPPLPLMWEKRANSERRPPGRKPSALTRNTSQQCAVCDKDVRMSGKKTFHMYSFVQHVYAYHKSLIYPYVYKCKDCGHRSATKAAIVKHVTQRDLHKRPSSEIAPLIVLLLSESDFRAHEEEIWSCVLSCFPYLEREIDPKKLALSHMNFRKTFMDIPGLTPALKDDV